MTEKTLKEFEGEAFVDYIQMTLELGGVIHYFRRTDTVGSATMSNSRLVYFASPEEGETYQVMTRIEVLGTDIEFYFLPGGGARIFPKI